MLFIVHAACKRLHTHACTHSHKLTHAHIRSLTQSAELKPFNSSTSYDAFSTAGFILAGSAFVGAPEDLNGEGLVYAYADTVNFPPHALARARL